MGSKNDASEGLTGLSRLGHERPLVPKYRGPTYAESAAAMRSMQICEDLLDIFSSSQMEVLALWRGNEKARDKDRKKRQRVILKRLEVNPVASTKMDKSDVYSVKKVFDLRNRAMELLTASDVKIDFDGGKRPLDYVIGEHINEAVPILSSYLTRVFKRASSRVIEQSLFALLAGVDGGYPRQKQYRQAMWVLAANLQKLEDGVPIQPWSKQDIPEWVPVQVVNVKKTAHTAAAGSVPGHLLEFLCLGGSPATCRFFKFMPSNAYYFMRVTMFGLPRKEEVLTPVVGFGGLRTWVLIEQGTKLQFERSSCNPAISDYNRDITKARKEPCPAGNPLPCVDCLVGLDKCARAVHFDSYDLRPCSLCGFTDAKFLSKDSTMVTQCLRCRNQGR